jgi:hypothetical protein
VVERKETHLELTHVAMAQWEAWRVDLRDERVVLMTGYS